MNNNNRQKSGCSCMGCLTFIVVLCGLIGGIATLFADFERDQYLKSVNNSTSTTDQPAISTTERPAITTTERPFVTTTEQPAVTTTENPFVTTTEQSAVTTTEQPAVSTTASENQTTVNPQTEKRFGSVGHISEDTIIVSIFVNSETMYWDYDNSTHVDTMYTALKYMGIGTDWLEEQCRRWGVETEFYYDWSKDNELFYLMDTDKELLTYLKETDASGIVTDHVYLRSFISDYVNVEGLQRKYGTDNIGYFFMFNTPIEEGYRSYTHWFNGETPEYCLMAVNSFNMIMEPAVYAHEILHLFGVYDLYYSNEKITEAYVQHMKDTNSNDIMYADYDITGKAAPDRVTNELTELDAYYLGLTDYSEDVERWNLGRSLYE